MTQPVAADSGTVPPVSGDPPRASLRARFRVWCRRRLPATAALGALGVVVALSAGDRDTVAELAQKWTRLDAALLARTAGTLVRIACASSLAAVVALLAVPRLRRPARAFLLLAALVGPLYPFALTPFSVPDETFHYEQVLARAAPLAGLATCDGAFALRPLGRHLHRNRPEGYVFLGGGGVGDAPSGDPFRASECRRKGNLLLYLPQTAGVAVGLRAGLGPRGIFYLGRTAAFVFYALCVFFAIRLSPAFRRAIAVIALCPIALQQAASFSYDCTALSAGFLCFALFLRLAARRGRLGASASLAAFAAVGAGMAVKGAAAAFLPLLAAIPTRRFRRSRLGKALFLLLAALVAAAALAASLSVLPGAVNDREPGTLRDGRPAHSVASVREEAWGTARIFLRTFDFDAVQLSLDAIGSRMSGLTLRLPAHVTLAFALAVFLSVRGDRRLRRSVPLRRAAGAGIVLLTLYLCFVMLFTETPERAGNVWGLQGRYWTPVLPLLLCLLFARDPRPDGAPPPDAGPDATPSGFLFPALALLHLDAVVFFVKTTLGG